MVGYEQTLERIHAHGRFSGTPCLDRIRALLAILGNPQKKLKFIHVAGTNGKGSIAVLSASALQQAGYKTGLYTSPFIMDFCERIRVNEQMIPARRPVPHCGAGRGKRAAADFTGRRAHRGIRVHNRVCDAVFCRTSV